MPETKTTESAVPELVILNDAQVELALQGELGDNVAIAIQDPRQIQIDIIKRILSSPNANSVLGGQQAVSGRECLERPFQLRGVRWHRSRFDQGLPVFAVLDAAFLDNGETAAVTTSAGNVMAQAYALYKLGALPCDVKIVESDHDTAAGFKPQWLERAGST